MKKEIKLTDALLRRQTGEKKRHYSHLQLEEDMLCWRQGRDWYDTERGHNICGSVHHA